MPRMLRRDVLAGLLVILFGAWSVVEGFRHPIGSALRMGPGYFPVALGAVLLLLGAVILVKGAASPGPGVDVGGFRPALYVLLGILAFGLLVQPFGVVPAVIALIAISSLARQSRNLPEVAVLAVLLSLFAVLVFVLGLGVPMRIARWPF